MKRAYRFTATLIIAVLCLCSVDASAEGFELSRFQPTGSMTADYLTVRSGGSALPNIFEAGVIFDYANDSLVANVGAGEVALVSHQTKAHIAAAVSGWGVFRLNVDVPIYLFQETRAVGELAAADGGGAGIGDIRLTPQVTVYEGGDRSEGGAGVAIAIYSEFSLPVGDVELLQGGGFQATPGVALDWASGSGWGAGLNLGYTFREDRRFESIEVRDALTWGVAGEAPMGVEWLTAIAEVHGEVPLANDELDAEEVPAEALLALRGVVLDGFVFTAGGGTAISGGAGSPDFRLLLGLGYSHAASEPDPDPDRDGIVTGVDGCPDVAEDVDGFEDADGCPEDDNDEDGIKDAVDECPDEAEDVDGDRDLDGCPEEDEVVEDGDRDRDGIKDSVDRCPDQPEDMDGHQDEDGCPDDDNDGDGIKDAVDRCPDRAETPNGYEDADGCPDTAPPKAVRLTPHVYFADRSARLDTDARRAIRAISEALKAEPSLTEVVVEGHADERGELDYNQDLSRRRAEAVRDALIQLGVSRDRVQIEARGERDLARTGDTVEDHRQNRRVEVRAMRAPAP